MPRSNNRPDPLERYIEAVLPPGRFIPCGPASAFMEELGDIEPTDAAWELCLKIH